MANEMVNNLQGLTDGVDTLTKKVNELYEAVARVKGVAASTITDVRGSINTMGGQYGLGNSGNSQMPSMASFSYSPAQGSNGQNILENSMADFSGQHQGAERRLAGTIAMATVSPQGGGGQSMEFMGINPGVSPLEAAYRTGLGTLKTLAAGSVIAMGQMPDTALTIQRDIGYYQAALRAPGISRGDLQRSTLKAMGHAGLSSVGADGMVAPILANAGYVPGSASFTQAAAEVGGAFRYLGMENAPAAQAIAGLHSGQSGANLYQYGIDTYNAATGEQKSTGQIAKELYGQMFQKGATEKDVQNALLMGNAGANLKTMGFTDAQQAIFSQMFIDIAGGRDPDLAKAESVGDNKNTSLDAIGIMNESETELMQVATGQMVEGFHDAAVQVNIFNEVLEKTAPALARLKGYAEGYAGSNVGRGIADAAPILAAAAADFLTAASLMVPGGGSSGYGARGLGGASSGYGAAIGGGAPVNGAISAGFGEKNNSGIWSSTNGTHTGVDYAVPVGTPVKSYMDGVVSSISPGADYGTAVVIDHPNGYQTLYGHLSSRDVQLGASVSAGQVIGKSGKSGNTTGPHLHYEVRRGKNNPVNPSELSGSKSGSTLQQQLSSRLGSLSTSGLLTLNQAFAQYDSENSESYSPSGTPTGKPHEVAKQMRDWLVSQGLSANGAFGVVANLMAESNMRTDAVGDKGTSYGIAQWHNERWDKLKAFSAQQGLDPSSLEAQKQFLMKELSHKGYKKLMGVLTDPQASRYDTTAAFMRIFERPKDQSDEAATKRFNRGLGALDIPGGGGSSGFGASIAAAAVGPQGNTTINITLKIDKASDEEAARFAKKVKEYLHNDSTISAMGSR